MQRSMALVDNRGSCWRRLAGNYAAPPGDEERHFWIYVTEVGLAWRCCGLRGGGGIGFLRGVAYPGTEMFTQGHLLV